eukprot:TRINITY_DN19154_c0_g2_i1.p1 TRINITY_DN19154_c0_g2~~TRINITY_DN19154_c0_g2_i1.p1  ORF type:complete len:700 (+),score=124.21 TRINITY_DN19154_c0_g2_i1:157-2100(+)
MVLEYVLCSQGRLLRRDPAGALKFLALVRVLGNHMTKNEEEGRDFFEHAFSEDVFSARVSEKTESLLEDLLWRRRWQPNSEAGDYEEQRRALSSALPPEVEGASEQPACGAYGSSSSSSAPRPRSRTPKPSRARLLSSSGCVWLLENACIHERNVILFGEGEDAASLPRRFIGCGEFGNYHFNAVEVHHPRARQRFLAESNTTEQPRTLAIVPGLLSSTSAHNPFHLLHSVVPLTWQLHHASYGICSSAADTDVRLAFISAFHGRRQSHFWRVFTRDHGTPTASMESLKQRFSIAAAWRFWWGSLSDRLPMPLGSDNGPVCYERVVFGRELYRTGIGGFANKRVMTFYRNYVASSFAYAGARMWRPVRKRPRWAPNDLPEWNVFEGMNVRRALEAALPREDRFSLADFASPDFAAPLFTESAGERLDKPPLRIWEEPGTADASAPAGRHLRGAMPLSQEPLPVHVLIVQRRPGTGRWIANLDEALRWATTWRHARARLEIVVADFDRLHPGAQWQLATQAHILIGVTGAALAWTAFLPHGGVVLDVFPPHSDFCKEGWNRNPATHYGGLSRLTGIQHACMVHPAALVDADAEERAAQGGSRQRKTEEKREVREKHGGYWHGQNVRLELPLFRRYFEEAVDRVLKLRA